MNLARVKHAAKRSSEEGIAYLSTCRICLRRNLQERTKNGLGLLLVRSKESLDLVQKATHLLFMNMSFIPGSSSTNVMGFFLYYSGSRLRHHICIVRRCSSGFASIGVNVASSTATRRVRTVALIANWAFANDLAVGISLRIGSNIRSTWVTLINWPT